MQFLSNFKTFESKNWISNLFTYSVEDCIRRIEKYKAEIDKYTYPKRATEVDKIIQNLYLLTHYLEKLYKLYNNDKSLYNKLKDYFDYISNVLTIFDKIKYVAPLNRTHIIAIYSFYNKYDDVFDLPERHNPYTFFTKKVKL